MIFAWAEGTAQFCDNNSLGFPFDAFCDAAYPIQNHIKIYTEFDTNIRHVIIYLLFFLYLFCIALVIVRLLLLPRDSPDNDDYENNGSIADHITICVCAITIAIAMGAVLQIPLTIVSNEILVIVSHLPLSYKWYVVWLDHRLVAGWWSLISLSSNISLFVLLPFAFFFRESDHVMFASRKGVGHKWYIPLMSYTQLKKTMQQVIVLVAMCWLVVGGTIHVILGLLGLLPERSYDVFFYISYLNLTRSVAGAALFFHYVPLGSITLLEAGWNLRIPSLLRQSVRQKWMAAVLDLDCLRHNQMGKEGPEFKRKIKEAQLKVDTWRKQMDQSPLKRNTACALVVGLSLLLDIALIYRLFRQCLNVFVGHIEGSFEPHRHIYGKQWFGLHSISMFGLGGAILEIVLVFYYLLCCMVGIYVQQKRKGKPPRFHRVSMTQLLALSTLCLILSSALPWLAWNVGVTKITPAGFNEKPLDSHVWWMMLLYNICFAWYSLVQWVHSPVMNVLRLVVDKFSNKEIVVPTTTPTRRPHRLSIPTPGSWKKGCSPGSAFYD